jgi:hypothetical protein
MDKKDKAVPGEYQRSIIENLERPVQISSADLNNDGKNDYLVCELVI